MKKALVYLGILVGNIATAQTNSIEVSATPKVWLNSLDVYRDDFGENALSSKNRLGINADVNLRRTTKKNWTYGLGIGWGQYSERLKIRYKDFSVLWANGSYKDRSMNGTYATNIGYLSAQVFGGYIFSLPSTTKTTRKLGVELGLKKMFFLQGGKGQIAQRLYVDMSNPASDFAIFKWGSLGMDQFSGPILAELSATYYVQMKNSPHKYFVGLVLSGFPAFQYPFYDGEEYDGMSTLIEYKRDMSGNRTYAKKGESTFPYYASVGIKIGVDLFNF
ncbi:hypothetical protein [Taibaiella sp. KBW10]|uniref:hypothetical protein n=1 Tax=Taibaiella sp. KBW10 TaxID=2153357 RepID=UPI000F59402D|nr:hypothetical protein [Taibaiella sp. KBW10]